MYQATAIILAGGKNSRMKGADKAQMVVDTLPMIETKIDMRVRIHHAGRCT